MPGTDLLTPAQLDQLQKQMPSRRRKPAGPAPTIQTVPFTVSTPPAFNVGQGSLTDRTVPDPVRQQRGVDVQKSVCQMLPADAKKPEICSVIP